jgi:hypothetical protein
LTGWAEAQLTELAALTRANLPSAATLLGERAALNGLAVPGRTSAGGGCRIYDALDGPLALNLSRPSDLELLPALVGEAFDPADLAKRIAALPVGALLERGRVLGLALAGFDEVPASPAVEQVVVGGRRQPKSKPLVVDLSALWAGPLAAQLLQRGGAEVIKVESVNRPDSLRHGDPAQFASLNRGKAELSLDLRSNAGQAALLALIARADVVIEAARPRALRQLGIDAAALVRAQPGLVWITLTGHGLRGEAANWIGFGDDAGIAGGLGRALREATGAVGFVGDALADPLSGIVAALTAAKALQAGQGGRWAVAMSGVVAAAMAGTDPAELAAELQVWANARGRAIAG